MTLDRENGTTPARRAISASPSCQCIASAARHGTAISSATFDHISGLNLDQQVSFGQFDSVEDSSVRALPLIESCKLVLPFFIPFTSSLEVVLIMQPATDSTTSGKSLGDVFPLHSTSSQINDQSIFLCRPLALLLSWRFCWMGRHAALPTGATTGEGIGGKLCRLPC